MLTTGRQFRDWSADSNYPFTDGSTMLLDDSLGMLPRDIFLDALVDAPDGWKAPFHISAFDSWTVEVSDATGGSPLVAAPPYYRLTRDGLDHGLLVPGPGYSVFMDRVGNRRVAVDPGALSFLPGRCFTASRAGRPYAKVNGATLNGVVRLVAAEGLNLSVLDDKARLSWDSSKAPSLLAIKRIGVKDHLGSVLWMSNATLGCDALTLSGGLTEQTFYVDNAVDTITMEGGGCINA